MKIVVISSSVFPASPETYGSEHQAAILANELENLGHDVTLFAPAKSMKGNYEHILIPSSYGIFDISSELHVWKYYFSTLENADFIIDMSATNVVVEKIYFYKRKFLKEKAVAYFRNGTRADFPRHPVKQYVHGVCLSSVAKRSIVESDYVPESLLHVIPYGIPDWYKPTENPSMDYILFIGSARPEKGIYTILKLAEKLPDEKFVFSWRATTPWHKEEEKRFLELAKNLKNVEFIELPENHLKEKIKLMQNAKAFIQINDKSFVEAMGLARLEACRCGAPVIAEDSESAREFLNEDIAFFVNSMEDAVSAIKNIGKIDRKKCYFHVKNNFSVETYARRYLELATKIKR